jgi:serine/threonine protein kinase
MKTVPPHGRTTIRSLAGRRSLTDDQWSRVSELVSRFEPLPKEEREVEFRKMLDQGEDEAVLSLVSLRLRLPPEGRIGQQIGKYKLLEQIGFGGMGVAYLAQHVDTGHRAVVKLIHPNLAATDQKATERFLREIQVLSRLDRSGIAQIIDGGIHTDPPELGGSSVPYFAMKYVYGDPITIYQRDRSLELTETLELFLKACDAVENAHSSHVVHCDLKPQHILIDTAGQPHVLDFGLARLFDPSIPDAARDLFAGTPAYTSPEQAFGLDVGFWSDVYTLGIILYELLTGRRPYEVPEGPPEAIRRAIREREPLKLGRLNSHDDAELERIVVKATQMDRSDRYQSVAALRYQLSRYLDLERRHASRKTGEAPDRFTIKLKDNILLRILFGRLEEVSAKFEDVIVVLPANEFFDDESFLKKHTSVGGYFKRHFTDEQIEDLKLMIKSKLDSIEEYEPIVKKPGISARSYKIGTCIYLDMPFQSDKRILLAACSTERMPEGNRAEAEFLFRATHCVHENIKDIKLYRRIVLPLLCSGNARMNRIRALHFLLLGFCETIYKSNPAHFEEIIIVVFKKSEESPPELDPAHVEEQLSFIKRLYQL